MLPTKCNVLNIQWKHLFLELLTEPEPAWLLSMCYKLSLNLPVSSSQPLHVNSSMETGITLTAAERKIELYRLNNIHSFPGVEISHLWGLFGDEAVAVCESQTMPPCFISVCQQLRCNLPEGVSM